MDDVAKILVDYGREIFTAEKFSAAELMRRLEPMLEKRQLQKSGNGGLARIAIIVDSAIGDFILTSPCLRELRRLYPVSHITLICDERVRDMAAACPYVDEVAVGPADFLEHDFAYSYPLMVQFIASHHLIERRFDMAFVCSVYVQAYLLAYIMGARRRIAARAPYYMSVPWGSREEWDGFITDWLPIAADACHIVDRHLAVFDAMLYSPVADRSIEAWTDQAATERAQEMLRDAGLLSENGAAYRLIAVSVGGTVRNKQWPVASYAQLLQRILIQQARTRFLLVGGSGDSGAASYMAGALPRGRVYDFTGRLKLTETVAVINECSMYIGNDTGPAHIAAACGVPVLEPNCWPREIPLQPWSFPVSFAPYQVPSVVVLAERALDDCRQMSGRLSGCNHSDEQHCIATITVRHVLEGFRLHCQMMAQGDSTVHYI